MFPVLYVSAVAVGGVPAGAVLVSRRGRRLELLGDPYGASAATAFVVALIVAAAVWAGAAAPVHHLAAWLVAHLSVGRPAVLHLGGSR